MKVQLKQPDIERALMQYIHLQGISLVDREVTIEFTAGRKGSGLSADVEISGDLGTNEWLEKEPFKSAKSDNQPLGFTSSEDVSEDQTPQEEPVVVATPEPELVAEAEPEPAPEPEPEVEVAPEPQPTVFSQSEPFGKETEASPVRATSSLFG